MIEGKLDNNLQYIIEKKANTQLVVFNILYKVGSRNEKMGKTGMAHFLEHLMFEGSKKFPSFDAAVHAIGGENNAFTTNDYTNYYQILPSENIEIAIQLEADRMQNLKLTKAKFSNQKKVVIEEFKESYLNIPYGEHWSELSKMMYANHPYEWLVIGYDIENIQNITYEDIQEFYATYYSPQNAFISVVGNIDEHLILEKIKTHFSEIENKIPTPTLNKVPINHQSKSLILNRNIPSDAFYMAFPTPGRFETNFHLADLASDILSNGESSILYKTLIKKEALLSEVDSYLSATLDTGMLVIEGKLNPSIELETVKEKLQKILKELIINGIDEVSLEKVKNKAISYCYYSNYQMVNYANNLSLFGAYSNSSDLKSESQQYASIDLVSFNHFLAQIFDDKKAGWLAYKQN